MKFYKLPAGLKKIEVLGTKTQQERKTIISNLAAPSEVLGVNKVERVQHTLSLKLKFRAFPVEALVHQHSDCSNLHRYELEETLEDQKGSVRELYEHFFEQSMPVEPETES